MFKCFNISELKHEIFNSMLKTYLAISSSMYFFTALSDTERSSLQIGITFVSSYSALGSWKIKTVFYRNTFEQDSK